MTVLSAVQKACSEALSLNPPSVLYSATKREWIELAALANAAAEYIAREHDWQALKKKATITGTGVLLDFDLPTDYARMLVKASLWSSVRLGTMNFITSTDEWLGMQTLGSVAAYGAYTLYGNQLHFLTAPALAETIQYFYITNEHVSTANARVDKLFSADGDSFRLSETLLKLAIIWMHKASKGREYAEDMATYEREKERLICKDGGSRMIRVGGVRWPSGLDMAYPMNVGV